MVDQSKFITLKSFSLLMENVSFQPTLELPAIERRDALPFEEGAPAPTVRKRRTYVILERVTKYGKTPGCRGCERVP